VSDAIAWTTFNKQIQGAFQKLVDAVSNVISDVRSELSSSANQQKPLHLVLSIFRASEPSRRLVISVMFSNVGNSWRRYCDVMHEDGPMIRVFPDKTLGPTPTPEELARSVEELSSFILTSEPFVVKEL
jgi:hypothetical protein